MLPLVHIHEIIIIKWPIRPTQH